MIKDDLNRRTLEEFEQLTGRGGKGNGIPSSKSKKER